MISVLLLPDQLYYHIGPIFDGATRVILFKDSKYFNDHTCGARMMYHLLAIHAYADFLRKEGLKPVMAKGNLAEFIHNKKSIRMFPPNSIYEYPANAFKSIQLYNNPYAFLIPTDELKDQTKQQLSRQKLFRVLLERHLPEYADVPSYDKESRQGPQTLNTKALKKGMTQLTKYDPPENYDKLMREIRNNYNPTVDNYDVALYYPWTRTHALQRLRHFISRTLSKFGPWQDATMVSEPFMFHSVLSAPINIGLLTPHEIILKSREVRPISSLEPFLRQIMGWREYIRINYHIQRGYRPYSAGRLPSLWYTGTGAPLDYLNTAITWVKDYAYAHHIVRLMYLGVTMKMLGLRPHLVYNWFLEMFIDAYPWVMAPNVYGMVFSLTPKADRRLMRRQYLMGASYVKKMSDFPIPKEQADYLKMLFDDYIKKHPELAKDYVFASRYRQLTGQKKKIARTRGTRR